MLSLHRAFRASAVFFMSSALGLCGAACAQGLTWGVFTSATSFGAGSPATSQTLPVLLAGSGRGSGTATLALSVSGGTNSWNGYGVGSNDDGYYPAPNMPVTGITMVTGAPGYNGGIAQLAQYSFLAGYNVAGGPIAVPTPPSDRAAIYFDAGSGTTATAQWNFTALSGGSLPAGSWLFIDNVDQGERLTASGPAGWIGSVHIGDSTLPRPVVQNTASLGKAGPTAAPAIPILPTNSVGNPTFPVCSPAVTMTATSVQLDGRYGDISGPTPTCSNVPVPVTGQTVGYTKGVDSVGVWIRTAVDLPALSLTVFDTDPSPQGQPDNNFVLGLGVIASITAQAPAVVPTLDVTTTIALAVLIALSLLAFQHFARRR